MRICIQVIFKLAVYRYFGNCLRLLELFSSVSVISAASKADSKVLKRPSFSKTCFRLSRAIGWISWSTNWIKPLLADQSVFITRMPLAVTKPWKQNIKLNRRVILSLLYFFKPSLEYRLMFKVTHVDNFDFGCFNHAFFKIQLSNVLNKCNVMWKK